MSTRTHTKMSVTLDPAAALAAKRLAHAEGVSVSAWLSRAALDHARLIDGLNATAEWETKHGAITDTELEAASHELTHTGATHFDPTRAAAISAALSELEADGEHTESDSRSAA